MVVCGYCKGNHSTGDMSSGCTGNPCLSSVDMSNPDNLTYSFDHVLSYVSSYVDCSTSGQLKCVLLKHFSDVEISNAKERLYYVINTIFKDPKKRMGPEKKSNEIDDILKGFSELELRGKRQEFCFACIDVKRLPKYSPEEFNVTDILSRLSLLEQQMSAARTDISEIKVKSVVNQSEVAQPHSRSYAAKAAVNAIQEPLKPRVVTNLRSRNNSVSSKRSVSEVVSDEECEKPKKRQKKKTVTGSLTSMATGLKGSDKYGEIFISHVVKGTEVEEVSNFLTSIECPSVECEKVSNENSRFDSFKVKLKEEFCLKLTSDEAERSTTSKCYVQTVLWF